MFVIDYYIKKKKTAFICKYIMLKADERIDDGKMSKCLARHKRLVCAHDLCCCSHSPVLKNTLAKSDGLKGPFGGSTFRSNRNLHAAIFPLTVHNTITARARLWWRVAKNLHVYIQIDRPSSPPPSPPYQKRQNIPAGFSTKNRFDFSFFNRILAYFSGPIRFSIEKNQ